MPIPRSLAAGVLFAMLSISGSGGAFAAEPATTGSNPLLAEGDRPSALGNYLAGRTARAASDTNAAAIFYSEALRLDPGNDLLAEQAFLMRLSEGQWDEAKQLAERITTASDGNRLARLFIAMAAFQQKDYGKTEDYLRGGGSGPIGDLTAALARAWLKLAQGNVDDALALLQPVNQAEFVQHYSRFHRALLADVAGRKADAREAYERLFKSDPRTVRIALAYARHLASQGDLKAARQVLKENIEKSGGEGHPVVRELKTKLDEGGKVEPLLSSATEGMAEVFYNLGEALSTEGGSSIGLIYLQMALRLRPDFPFALAALANVYEATKRYSDAIQTYDRVPPGGPLDVSIEVRKAINLNLLDRQDEAVALLEKTAAANPTDVRPLDALGSILRARKRWDEAIVTYTKAIDLIDKPEKQHWTYFYARGTSFERAKQWSKAETDLVRAMKLNPEQPLILNYLGYSWIDQNKNLQRGLKLIEKAVSLKPDDGYIVDSLGWAHYRLGNFTEATRYLERAVELRPEDPVLNDHLGDAYWHVGRTREAKFQWEQALTLNPEPEDAEKIRGKVQAGLAAKRITKTTKKQNEASKSEPVKKRVETQQTQPGIFQ